MTEGLTQTDRRLLWGAGAAALLLIALTLGFGAAESQSESPVPSSYSSDPGGALAAYLLLQDLGVPVTRWEQSPERLPEARGALLILAQPTELPETAEREALVDFVTGGGRILFSGSMLSIFFESGALDPAEMGPVEFDPEWKRFEPELPTAFTRDVDEVVLRPQQYWSQLDGSQLELAGGDRGAVVVAWRLGEGEVIWWAGATPLTNAGIARSGNLNLLLNTIYAGSGADASGAPLTVYWDEYFHGQRGSLWSYVADTPLTWGMLQTGLLVLAVIATFSRRSGPVVAPRPVSRLSPLEFVDTMGGLYDRAGAEAIAVEVSYKHLRLELARRLRMPAGAPDQALAEAAGKRLGMERDQLQGCLEESARAAAPAGSAQPLPRKRSLELVAAMKRYELELRGTRGAPGRKY